MAYAAMRTLAILGLGLLSGCAHAQEPRQPDSLESYEADPPGRAARLSYLEGDVSLQPVGEQEWAPAFVNRPLTTGDKLWTENGARAEIHVGPAAIRLDDNTGFSFLEINDDTIHMRITAGVMHVTVVELDGSEQIDIATPNVALGVLRAGTYRVEVNDEGDSTVVKVTDGALEATGPDEPLLVHAGQAVTFDGIENLEAKVASLGPSDEFDSWARDRAGRDASASTSRTAKYVSRDVTGYEDLDEHGDWVSEPEYGYVWTPRYVAVDWAPYRYGRWVWVSPWGWTWIDDSRWGYAPFHYGRWVHVRHRWCWVPGPRHHRAVFAPALVGWIGAPGGHAWYPLGPRDVYVPWHRHSWHYVDRVNRSNARVARALVREVFENRHRRLPHDRVPRHGITAASRNAFTSAGNVRDHRVRLNERELTSRGLVRTLTPGVLPARESRLGGNRNARAPSRGVVDRPVVVRRAPPREVSASVRTPVRRDQQRAPQVDRDTQGRAAMFRNRTDRPPRENRQSFSPGEQRSMAGRLRDFRERAQARPDGGLSSQGAQRDYRERMQARPNAEPSSQGSQQGMAARLRDYRERVQSRPNAAPDGGNVRQWRTPDVQQQGHVQQQSRPSFRERFQRPAEAPRMEQRREHRPNVNVQRPQVSQPRPQSAPRPQVSQPRPQSAPRSEAPRPQSQPRVQQAPRSSESSGSRGNGNFSRSRRH